MAEAAAAAAVYETVETTAQLGVGAYMVSKPTMPLKATFKQIATSSDDQTRQVTTPFAHSRLFINNRHTRLSLSRSGHSLSIVKEKAYIFGGETAAGKLASNEVHVVTLQSSETPEPDYSVIPAVTDPEGGNLPTARKRHAACAFNICVAVFSGVDENDQVIDEPFIWLFNTGKSAWEKLEPKDTSNIPAPRRDGRLFDCNNNLVLYGGFNSSGESLKDVWYFNYVEKTWTELPQAPVSTKSVALSDGVLCAISSSDNLSGDLYILPIEATSDEQHEWTHVPFPTNPLTPGPSPRTGAGLLPISTGYGRQYLLYIFGTRIASEKAENEPPTPSEPEKAQQLDYCSDMWTYQLPSSAPQAKLTTNVYEALKPAKIKDAIRGALGLDDGKHSWSEVEVLLPSDLSSSDGKVHPGPRAFFASDVMKDGRTMVIWGGINPKGECEGDGWTITLE